MIDQYVYVIIVEMGEFSDQEDWIGGVYDDRTTAERVLLEKSAEAREQNTKLDDWQRKQWTVRGRFTVEENARNGPQVMEAILSEVGPAPEGQRGDRFYIVEVPLNQWGDFLFLAAKLPALERNR